MKVSTLFQPPPIFPTPPSMATSFLLSVFMFDFFLDSAYKGSHAVFVFLYLAYFT